MLSKAFKFILKKINLIACIVIGFFFISIYSCKKKEFTVQEMLMNSWNVFSDKIDGVEFLNKELYEGTELYLTSCGTYVNYDSYNNTLSSAQIIFNQGGTLTNKGTQSYKSMNPDSTYETCVTQYFIGYDSFTDVSRTWEISTDEKLITIKNEPFHWASGTVTQDIFKFSIEEISSNKLILKGYSTNKSYYNLSDSLHVSEVITLTR